MIEEQNQAAFAWIILQTNLFQAFFTVNNGVAQYLMVTQGMTAAEYSLFRSAFNMIFAFLLLRSQNVGVIDGVTREHVPALLIRCGVGTLNFIIVMYCVKLLPLTIFFMISQMAPFLTALIAWLWLSESITQFELFAIIGSYLGIAMIGISQPPSEDGVVESGNKYLLGIILSLFTAIGMALISTSTRKLKQINYAVIQVIYASSSTIVSGIIVFGQNYPSGKIPFIFSSKIFYALLIVAAVCNFYGQNLMTICNQKANPALIGLLSYCGVIYNFVADVFILNKSFTEMQLTGVLVILCFNMLAGISKIRGTKDYQAARG